MDSFITENIMSLTNFYKLRLIHYNTKSNDALEINIEPNFF